LHYIISTIGGQWPRNLHSMDGEFNFRATFNSGTEKRRFHVIKLISQNERFCLKCTFLPPKCSKLHRLAPLFSKISGSDTADPRTEEGKATRSISPRHASTIPRFQSFRGRCRWLHFPTYLRNRRWGGCVCFTYVFFCFFVFFLFFFVFSVRHKIPDNRSRERLTDFDETFTKRYRGKWSLQRRAAAWRMTQN